jgi:adenosine deaminase
VWFIADATRQWGVEAAERVLDAALDLREHRIVGFGMGGDETALRAKEFRGIYRRAREHGLGITCHAGEGTTPEAVLEVVEELEVKRVGHGIAAARNPDLMRQLAEAGIVLEVCPTSNRRTGAWDVHGRHPLFTLLEAGVPCVLGSDDPAFFGCTLRSELFAIEQDGLDHERVLEMCERSLTCGFA